MTQRSPSTPDLMIARVYELPFGFDQLRAEAADEGFNNIETLWRQWQDGTNRFTLPGEMLVAATINGELAGIGGITQDFVDPAWLRMRRFYVRPAFRRRGIGRGIARYILDQTLPLGRQICLYAGGHDAEAFWPELGFAAIDRENTTHALQTDQR